MGNPNCCFMIIAGTFFFSSQSPRGTVIYYHSMWALGMMNKPVGPRWCLDLRPLFVSSVSPPLSLLLVPMPRPRWPWILWDEVRRNAKVPTRNERHWLLGSSDIQVVQRNIKPQHWLITWYLKYIIVYQISATSTPRLGVVSSRKSSCFVDYVFFVRKI